MSTFVPRYEGMIMRLPFCLTEILLLLLKRQHRTPTHSGMLAET